jgi:hypothetical protein
MPIARHIITAVFIIAIIAELLAVFIVVLIGGLIIIRTVIIIAVASGITFVAAGAGGIDKEAPGGSWRFFF